MTGLALPQGHEVIDPVGRHQIADAVEHARQVLHGAGPEAAALFLDCEREEGGEQIAALEIGGEVSEVIEEGARIELARCAAEAALGLAPDVAEVRHDLRHRFAHSDQQISKVALAQQLDGDMRLDEVMCHEALREGLAIGGMDEMPDLQMRAAGGEGRSQPAREGLPAGLGNVQIEHRLSPQLRNARRMSVCRPG